MCTKGVRVDKVGASGLVEPAGNMDEVGHEARHETLEHGRVAEDHELIASLRTVGLAHHCRGHRTNTSLNTSSSQLITNNMSNMLSCPLMASRDRQPLTKQCYRLTKSWKRILFYIQRTKRLHRMLKKISQSVRVTEIISNAGHRVEIITHPLRTRNKTFVYFRPLKMTNTIPSMKFSVKGILSNILRKKDSNKTNDRGQKKSNHQSLKWNGFLHLTLDSALLLFIEISDYELNFVTCTVQRMARTSGWVEDSIC